MNWLKWKFMSKYKKLLYTINVCRSNKQVLHLENGFILDFSNMTIKKEKESK